jgi:nanoRNase/pAp phosphatase (c-di-AMP/oligoRNAs hydrolase)
VDGNGNVYVFGYSFPASSNMGVIIRLAQDAGGAAVGGGGHNGGGSCFIGATFLAELIAILPKCKQYLKRILVKVVARADHFGSAPFQ